MNKLQRGFAAIETLLILIIMGIIGGTGYYVAHSKAQTDKSLNNASASSQNTTVSKTSKKPSSPATVSSVSDTELIATAIADKCHANTPSIDASKVKTVLLNLYSGSNSPLRLSGNYANTGATCSETTNQDVGGFAALLKKNAGKWIVVFEGQQSPDCEAVDNQGWPASVLAQCYDSATQAERAPK